MTIQSGRTAIAILTSALANIEGFAGADHAATLRYLADARELMRELEPSEVGMVLLKLGSMAAALLDELASERGMNPEELLRQVALAASEQES